MHRLACLVVPLFPLAARLRSEPDLGREALAILQGNGSAARVVAVNRRARQGGVRPAMTLTQARAVLPKLIARGRDEPCERAAQEALLETADAFSPRVEDGGEGVVFLDLDGLERHFRGGSRPEGNPLPETGRRRTQDREEGETALGRALAAAAAGMGLPARVGIASSKLAARVAAGLPATPTVVPAGGEAAFLAPLPLARLCPEAEVAATLRHWGIRSVGDFARLPEDEVASRLGRAGQALHATARGLDPRPLIPRQPPPGFQEGIELEWPLVALEPFLFVARAALDRLCRRLESQGLACARLELALRLEPDGHHQRSLALPSPTRDAKTLLTLIRLDLEALPPGAPVTGFTFTASPDRPREAQLTLFGPPALSPDRLATTLARLFTLLGAGRVGSPRTVAGHRPERFALVDYAPPPPPAFAGEPGRGRGLMAIRVLRPPVLLEVITAGEGPPQEGEAAAERSAAAPRSLRLPPGEAAAGSPRLEGRVQVAAGPWRVEEAWWSEQPAEREYWDVELAEGGLYRIYRDLRSEEWFADGVYD